MKRLPIKRTAFRRRNVSRNMYGAIHCSDADGNQFDSKNEMARYKSLELKQRCGLISDLTLHPKIVLIEQRDKAPEIAWHPDYSYVEDGRTIYEDSKPRKMDARELLLCKLWKHFGPGLLIFTGASRDGFKVLRKVMPTSMEGAE